MATSLKSVQAKRKKIMKAHPNMSNSAALKLAWKQARGGRVSGVKKKVAKKRKISGVKKKAAPKRRTVAGVRKRSVGSARPTPKKLSGIGAIKAQAREAKKDLDDALGKEMVRQYNATTKTAKRKIGKKVSEIKKSINSVKKIINKK